VSIIEGREKFWAAVIQVIPAVAAAFGLISADQAVALNVAMAPLIVYLTGNSPITPKP
jgi:hypothetical protein